MATSSDTATTASSPAWRIGVRQSGLGDKDGVLGKGSLTYADGNLVYRNESGEGTIWLVEASAEGFKEHGHFNQPDRSKTNSWPHPVIANGKLYIRDQDVLLCYNVKAQ